MNKKVLSGFVKHEIAGKQAKNIMRFPTTLEALNTITKYYIIFFSLLKMHCSYRELNMYNLCL